MVIQTIMGSNVCGTEVEAMFQTGDLIIYGNSGVCSVDEVCNPESTKVEDGRMYYKLRPLYSTETIFIPVDTKVFMRPIISRREAEALIAGIPSTREQAFVTRNLSMLKEHYESSLQTHDCGDLLQLIRSVYSKGQDATQNKRKLGQLDQRYMKRAEDLLYGELAVALDIPRDEVLAYIESVVKSKQDAVETENRDIS